MNMYDGNNDRPLMYGTLGMQFSLSVAPRLRRKAVTVEFAQYSPAHAKAHRAQFPYGDSCIITAHGSNLTGAARREVLARLPLVPDDAQ